MNVQLTEYPAGIATPSDTAIIISHGMGQQVPFQTLDGIVEALIKAETEAGRPSPIPRVTLRRNEESYLPRAEITLAGEDGKAKQIHLYEVYWAPITEGKVTSLDVLSFLFDGGREGFVSSIRGNFRRFLYGGWQSMQIKRQTGVLILSVLSVLLSVILHYLSTLLLVLGQVLPLLGFSPIQQPLLERAAQNWQWMLVTGIAVLLFGAGLTLIRKVALKGADWNRPTAGMRAWLWLPLFAIVVLVFLTTACATFVLLLGKPIPPNLIGPLVNILHLNELVANHHFEICLFGLLGWAFLLWSINTVVIEYVGDVAAYVSAYKLNKFWMVREEIQGMAFKVFKAVYGQKYGKIIVVGHSLGSVVAYDAYNAMVREVEMVPDLGYTVVDRTKALVTFGSPLDKTAYLFRQHLKETVVGVREALAEAVQPLIADFANWPGKWVNIYSPADIISGQLDYYQLPEGLPGGKTVENIIDYEANVPLLAHNQYWDNRCLRKTLHQLCVTECGRHLSVN